MRIALKKIDDKGFILIEKETIEVCQENINEIFIKLVQLQEKIKEKIKETKPIDKIFNKKEYQKLQKKLYCCQELNTILLPEVFKNDENTINRQNFHPITIEKEKMSIDEIFHAIDKMQQKPNPTRPTLKDFTLQNDSNQTLTLIKEVKHTEITLSNTEKEFQKALANKELEEVIKLIIKNGYDLKKFKHYIIAMDKNKETIPAMIEKIKEEHPERNSKQQKSKIIIKYDDLIK